MYSTNEQQYGDLQQMYNNTSRYWTPSTSQMIGVHPPYNAYAQNIHQPPHTKKYYYPGGNIIGDQHNFQVIQPPSVSYSKSNNLQSYPHSYVQQNPHLIGNQYLTNSSAISYIFISIFLYCHVFYSCFEDKSTARYDLWVYVQGNEEFIFLPSEQKNNEIVSVESLRRLLCIIRSAVFNEEIPVSEIATNDPALRLIFSLVKKYVSYDNYFCFLFQRPKISRFVYIFFCFGRMGKR